MRGTIPPGTVIPLHSHPDPETYLAIEGKMEALVEESSWTFAWIRIAPQDVLHVPADAKHAFWNRSDRPAVVMVVTTQRLGHFFREVGEPAKGRPAGPPSQDRIQHFLAAAVRHGHWNAPPEEHAWAADSAP
ncbi:cupin domain-containing protein [Dongia deserti]|uniref:cupin domain-containing protein n=1 Tax=Dongia deserti TaxID=2268030 RepID=UPI0013C4FBEF|nr:cupin domain-containing protein [Dongia deserti]